MIFLITPILADGSCNIDSLLSERDGHVGISSERWEIENQLGMCYLLEENYDSSEFYLHLALDMAEELGDTLLRTKTYCSLGRLNYETERGLEAINFYTKALKSEKLSEEKQLDIYNEMGVIYLRFDELQKSIQYFNRALEIVPMVQERTGESYDFLYNNKGLTFSNMGLLDSALSNHYKCLASRLVLEDPLAIGQSYNNLGSVFYELGAYDSALYYFNEGLIYREKVSDVRYSAVVESKINIAKTQISLGNLGGAERSLIGLEDTIRYRKDRDLDLRLSEEMMRYYEKLGDYQKAFQYSQHYYELKDSLYNITMREELIRINLNGEYEAKRREDSLMAMEELQLQEIKQEKEDRENQMLVWGLVIVMLLMGAIIITVYRNLRSKKKASDIILKQKEEVEFQRDLAQNEKKVADEQREIAQVQKEELELVHQEITDSINYAKRIQNAILPPEDVMDRILRNYFAYYLPKAIVAGDFYWVHQADGMVYFAAADCTGHGVPGAFVSIMCSNALDRAVEEFGCREPGHILDRTTDLIVEAFEKNNYELKDGMDISLCMWDQSKKKMAFAGANNPIYVITPHRESNESVLKNESHQLRVIKGNKQSVGWHVERNEFITTELTLENGDLVYSFTDGFPDQFGGPKGKKFKYLPFKELLLSVAHLPLNEQKARIHQAFLEWKGDLEQVDDICILGFQVTD